MVKINLTELSGFQEKTSNRNSYKVVTLICNSILNGFRLTRPESVPGLESWLWKYRSLTKRFSFPEGRVLMPVI